MLELPTDASSGVDLAALRRALRAPSVKACLLSSSFNNPLGCTMSDEKKKAVLELLAKRRIPLIEDDIYGDIYFGEERPKPFTALDAHGITIYCSSFSKTIAQGIASAGSRPGAIWKGSWRTSSPLPCAARVAAGGAGRIPF